jgi:hypothetical protein
MKRGQIILLWVGGLWTVLVTVGSILDLVTIGSIVDNDPPAYVSYYIKVIVLLSLPVWIVCGLIWVTKYRTKSSR